MWSLFDVFKVIQFILDNLTEMYKNFLTTAPIKLLKRESTEEKIIFINKIPEPLFKRILSLTTRKEIRNLYNSTFFMYYHWNSRFISLYIL